MAILVDQNTKLLVQGITGEEGSKATKEMLDYGTEVVCGVTPGKGGQEIEGKPVYNTIREALKNHPDVNASVVYVPPIAGKDACIEAIVKGIKLIVCITETIPVHDTAEIIAYARKYNARLIGPSSLGIISPGKGKIGSLGGSTNRSYIHGNIGIISKSGGMCSETALLLKQNNIGTSTVISIGGDVISGSDFCDLLELFEQDDETKAVIIFGEIGGAYEQKIADMILEKKFTKPIIAFISGKFASTFPYVALGHAGAIIEGKQGTREAKVEALKKAGVKIAEVHHEIVDLIKEVL